MASLEVVGSSQGLDIPDGGARRFWEGLNVGYEGKFCPEELGGWKWSRLQMECGHEER